MPSATRCKSDRRSGSGGRPTRSYAEQLSRQSDQSQEYQSDRSKVAKARKVIGTVRVDHGDSLGQFFIALVMIDHHCFDTAPFGLRRAAGGS